MPEDDESVVDLKARRIDREFERQASQRLNLVRDLRDVILSHREQGCPDDVLIQELADAMVRIGVMTRTNGRSLLCCLGAAIDNCFVCDEDFMGMDFEECARFANWFDKGVPEDLRKPTRMKIYRAKGTR